MNVLLQSFTHIRSSKLKTYDFSVTNEDSELLNLNKLNVNITLLSYKREDVYDKIKDFIRLSILKSEQKK